MVLSLQQRQQRQQQQLVVAETLNDGGRGDILWRPGANR